MIKKYKFKSKVWLYHSTKCSWYFVNLPEDLSVEIKFLKSGKTKGWGAIRCNAKIGNSLWQTSIFPYAKTKTYILPIKKEIRKEENISENKTLNISLEIDI